jgi:transcriptional regulator with XRE-family HTH domain
MTALHTEEYRRFAAALRDQREKAGLSQDDVASRLGVGQDFVSKVETARRRLDVIEFLRFVGAIGCNPLDIFEAVGDAGRFEPERPARPVARR